MEAFTQSLEAAGIELSLVDSNLELYAPKGTINHVILAQIKQHKSEIIRFLSKSPQGEVKAFEPVHIEPAPPPQDNTKHRPSPIALAWLLEHRQALDKAGWTRAELYRRNKSSPGIAWLKLWDQALLLTHLHADGVIEFECSINGKDYVQTARPRNFTTRTTDNRNLL
jgi:hypothetical protein